MADLQQIADMCADLELRKRIGPALARVAIDILGESAPGEGSTLDDLTVHFKRRARASAVLAGVEFQVEEVQWAMCCWRESGLPGLYESGGGQAGISDGDIEYVLLAVWDSLAGA